MDNEVKEETLDPEDWDEMRALGHRMIDDMMTRMETKTVIKMKKRYLTSQPKSFGLGCFQSEAF